MELRVDFGSQDDWRVWHARNSGSFATWTQSIVESVRSQGYVEPLTGTRVDAKDVRIDQTSRRESLAFNGLNSRKRALLLELDILLQSPGQSDPSELRIYTPEALTRTVMILRGRYPYFLGTEYIPDARQRLGYFPIQHADLHALDMPDAIYDIVVVGDEAWQHVTLLQRSIEEIARILRPGGAFIATCCFAHEELESVVRKELRSAGNPCTQLAGYSGTERDQFVETNVHVPGWNILDICREANLRDARMVLHASSVHGITGDSTPGVFLLSAVKSDGAIGRPKRNWLWNSNHIHNIIGLVGIPRSGTTMFAAVLEAHNSIVSIYEPWNAQKSTSPKDQTTITVASLIGEAERQDGKANTLLIKETTLNPVYAENLSGVLAQALPPLSQHLIFLLRNPFHCFLSEVEARREWWGETEIQVNELLFDRWAERSLASFLQMVHLSERHPSAFVSYEGCVCEPTATFTEIMCFVGLDFLPQQLSIADTVDVSRIRGDISLVVNTRDVADESIAKRKQEMANISGAFAGSKFFNKVQQVTECVAAFRHHGVVTSAHPERYSLVTALREAATMLRT